MPYPKFLLKNFLLVILLLNQNKIKISSSILVYSSIYILNSTIYFIIINNNYIIDSARLKLDVLNKTAISQWIILLKVTLTQKFSLEFPRKISFIM